MKDYKTIDQYIKSFPKDVQILLQSIRETISRLVPNGEEAIRYGMPTFRLNNKNLIHFAAYDKHIGLYPTPSAIVKFKKELLKYKTSKGAIQFPINEKLPIALISKIIKFRLSENAMQQKSSKK